MSPEKLPSVKSCLDCDKDCPQSTPIFFIDEKRIVAEKGTNLYVGPASDSEILPLETRTVLRIERTEASCFAVRMEEVADGGKPIEGLLYLAKPESAKPPKHP